MGSKLDQDPSTDSFFQEEPASSVILLKANRQSVVKIIPSKGGGIMINLLIVLKNSLNCSGTKTIDMFMLSIQNLNIENKEALKDFVF